MEIKIIAVGEKMPAWVTSAFQEYLKRLPPNLQIKLIEIPLLKRSKNADTKRLMEQEGSQMLKATTHDDLIIALEVTGKTWDSITFAKKLQQWHNDSQNIALLIGGPEGLAPACLQEAKLHWSLSPLTLPHPLVRIILAEQIYRAWSINAGLPYHR